ncbi:hypothetical protein BD560DRAFT_397889 [Blakeslea trispora]|nr:hypothetical protein BD560DRAFT_397889 [Blakeslea trispora]
MKSKQDPQHDLLSQVNSQPLNKNEITDYTQQTLLDVNSQPMMHSLTSSHLPHPILGTTEIKTHTPSEQLLHAAAAVVAANSSHSLLMLGQDEPSTSMLDSAKPSSPSMTSNALNVTDTETSQNAIEPLSPPIAPAIPMDPSNPVLAEFYRRFSVGRMFDSLEELRTEAYEYGRKHNVALTTSKSDKTKIYLICKHGGQYRRNTKRPPPGTVKPRIRKSQKTGCACMIYARHCKGSFWVIRKSIGEHNHPVVNDETQYAMYRTLTPEQLLDVHRLLRDHVSVALIVKSLKSKGANNILAKDIENIQQDLKRREVLDLPSGHPAILPAGLTASSSNQIDLNTITHITDNNTIDSTYPPSHELHHH